MRIVRGSTSRNQSRSSRSRQPSHVECLAGAGDVFQHLPNCFNLLHFSRFCRKTRHQHLHISSALRSCSCSGRRVLNIKRICSCKRTLWTFTLCFSCQLLCGAYHRDSHQGHLRMGSACDVAWQKTTSHPPLSSFPHQASRRQLWSSVNCCMPLSLVVRLHAFPSTVTPTDMV